MPLRVAGFRTADGEIYATRIETATDLAASSAIGTLTLGAAGDRHPTTERMAGPERPQRMERMGLPERPQRMERIERLPMPRPEMPAGGGMTPMRR